MKKSDFRHWVGEFFAKPKNKFEAISQTWNRGLIIAWDALLWITGLSNGQGLMVLLIHFLAVIGLICLYKFFANGR
jgi:hypothetical protein